MNWYKPRWFCHSNWHIYNYTLQNNIVLYRTIVGDTSGDIYLYGKMDDGISDYAYFRRIHNNYTEVWVQGYDVVPNIYAFDIDSAETYTYSLVYDSSEIKFFKLDASNGQINQVISESSRVLNTASDNITISLSPVSEVLYLIV